MNTKTAYFLFSLCLFQTMVFQTAWSQSSVVDDTTKQPYNERTVIFLKEQDIYENKKTQYHPDTITPNLYEYDFKFRGQPLYQDLGLLGSALQPLLFQPNSRSVGVSYGWNAYDPYAFDADSMYYVNTQSPYTYLYYMQGGNGRQRFSTGLTRNITPHLNIGFNWRTLSAERQIGNQGQDDGATDHNSLVVHGNYVSANGRYRAMAHFNHLRHQVFESGGVQPPAVDETFDDLFDYNAERVRLGRTAKNRDSRNLWHLYHHLDINKEGTLQLFHEFDRVRRFNLYSDDTPIGTATDISTYYFPFDTVLLSQSQAWEYQLDEHRAGIKGRYRTQKFGDWFYATWLRRKDFRLYFNDREVATPSQQIVDDNETFIGGELRQEDSTSQRYYYLKGEYLPGADYHFEARTRRTFWQVAFVQRNYSPNLQQNYYRSFLFEDKPDNGIFNDFDRTTSTHLMGQIQYNKKRFVKASLSVEATRLANYIYYGTDARPKQTSDRFLVSQIVPMVHFRYSNINLQTHYYFTQTENNVVRQPQHFMSSKLYYDGNLFKKALHLQAGFAVRYRSAYLGYDYMPVTQIFYLQNDFVLRSNWVADAFMQVRVRSLQVFLRMPDIARLVSPDNGYFVTPWYPAPERSFEFGFLWHFYN